MPKFPFLSAFDFDQPAAPLSLYAYAPVFRIQDRRGDWVVKRTGHVHSSAEAIAAWLIALRRMGVEIVAPSAIFSPNPRRLADGKDWVVYPFISGQTYTGSIAEIRSAGDLLGRIHAAAPLEAEALAIFKTPILRSAEWLERHAGAAIVEMRKAGFASERFVALVDKYGARSDPVQSLPLSGCSFDYKAANLIFAPHAVLIDPDNAALAPRILDLATALLLFHCDAPTAPARLWNVEEWKIFLSSYRRHVDLTSAEHANWPAVLRLAWLDQAVWLLGNWPEDWSNPKEANYLFSLATADLDRFTLME
ncbi:MAG TPA: phosphotransferase [Methylocella sp.]|nr:phosphotransferase [Methylocella sp.]